MIGWTDQLGVSADPERFTEAIKALRRKAPMTDGEWEELEGAERARAFKVGAVAQADLVQEVFNAIDRAVEKGEAFDDFKAAVGDSLEEAWGGTKPGRLETIFRTNVLTSYNAGRYEIFQKPAVRAARPYQRYDAIDDSRTDDACAEADGTVLPADDPWWRTHIPPLHPNCRCSFIALTPSEAEDEGIDESGPAAPAADGFGQPPAADDWKPDPTKYSAPVREVLRERLNDAE